MVRKVKCLPQGSGVERVERGMGSELLEVCILSSEVYISASSSSSWDKDS